MNVRWWHQISEVKQSGIWLICLFWCYPSVPRAYFSFSSRLTLNEPNLEFIKFYSFTLKTAKSSAVCHLVFLSSPLLSVTSSLYPPRHPTALPEFCWDHRYGESGDNAEEKNKKRLTCAGLISHNPPTLEPAVSSYSPLFFSVFCISHNFVLLLSFCHSPQFLLHHAPLTLVSFLCAVLGNDCVQQRYCTMSCNATLLLFPRTWCGGSRACEQTRTCIPAHRHTERVM